MGQRAVEYAATTLLYVLDIPQQQALIRGDRGFVDAYIDCGRLAQRLVLSATAAGLRTHQTPALRDPLVERLIGVSPGHAHLLYAITIG